MKKIFGIDPSKKVTTTNVRDAMKECFYNAHCKDTGIDQGDEELTREYCEEIVKKAFSDTGGDFEEPKKQDILKAMAALSEFSANFRDDDVIKKNYMKINELAQKL